MIGPLFDVGFASGQESAKAEIARLRAGHAELLGALKEARLFGYEHPPHAP